ncbi:MAG: Coenzyme F420 hydrogenase/dehydrogenase, beta subunit C-terminal domain [Victivallales bacterium]|nr:Coenzyme F420 hydrogenase/dehydrogenase, beta subunit C-terminal domain [Victivallales bacterium]
MGNGLPVLPDADVCCGCAACAVVCPAKAIQMLPDGHGFVYPKVDEGHCLGCGKCVRTCPVMSSPTPQLVKEAWGAVTNRKEELMRSSSGGIFQLLAQKVLSDGGVVFGARFDSDFNVVLDCSDDISELSKFQGSKYVQSSENGAYLKAIEALKAGHDVLFSGTPCQLAALKKVLGDKEVDGRLFTVGFVCHGVPSPKVWQKYLQERMDVFGKKIAGVNFRDKCLSWYDFSMTIFYSDGERYSCIHKHDPFIRGFLQHLFLRPACFHCRFKYPNWTQDITLADFWKVKKFLPQLFDAKGGVSLVMVHSDAGKRLLESISDQMQRLEVSVEKAMASNPASMKSAKNSPYSKAFWQDYGKFPLLKLLRWYNYRVWWKTLIHLFPNWRHRHINEMVPDSRPSGKH